MLLSCAGLLYGRGEDKLHFDTQQLDGTAVAIGKE